MAKSNVPLWIGSIQLPRRSRWACSVSSGCMCTYGHCLSYRRRFPSASNQTGRACRHGPQAVEVAAVAAEEDAQPVLPSLRHRSPMRPTGSGWCRAGRGRRSVRRSVATNSTPPISVNCHQSNCCTLAGSTPQAIDAVTHTQRCQEVFGLGGQALMASSSRWS